MKWIANLTTSPSTPSKTASQPSMAWGNPWLASLPPACASWWIGSISTSEKKKTRCRARERRRLSLRRGGILGRIDTSTVARKEISQGNRRQPMCRVSGLYSENRCIRCWKKSRANHTLDGRIRWRESRQSETSTFIANTTKTTNTPQRITGTSRITWTSWTEKESWSTCCVILAIIRARHTKNQEKIPPWGHQ